MVFYVNRLSNDNLASILFFIGYPSLLKLSVVTFLKNKKFIFDVLKVIVIFR